MNNKEYPFLNLFLEFTPQPNGLKYPAEYVDLDLFRCVLYSSLIGRWENDSEYFYRGFDPPHRPEGHLQKTLSYDQTNA